jgi:hypothetical protein
VADYVCITAYGGMTCLVFLFYLRESVVEIRGGEVRFLVAWYSYRPVVSQCAVYVTMNEMNSVKWA